MLLFNTIAWWSFDIIHEYIGLSFSHTFLGPLRAHVRARVVVFVRWIADPEAPVTWRDSHGALSYWLAWLPGNHFWPLCGAPVLFRKNGLETEGQVPCAAQGRFALHRPLIGHARRSWAVSIFRTSTSSPDYEVIAYSTVPRRGITIFTWYLLWWMRRLILLHYS